jgi:hypothetical protein
MVYRENLEAGIIAGLQWGHKTFHLSVGGYYGCSTVFLDVGSVLEIRGRPVVGSKVLEVLRDELQTRNQMDLCTMTLV